MAAEAEKVLCGRSRHKRLCLECKRSRGVYTRRTRSNVGSSEIPMVVTRQVLAADGLSEFFPRSMHRMPEPPSPRIMRVLNPSRNVNLVTPVVVFCPRCSTWQDMLAFSQHSRRLVRWPTPLWNHNPDDPEKDTYSNLQCNHCVASILGVKVVQAELLQLFIKLANDALLDVQERLNWGWGKFIDEFYDAHTQSHGTLNQPKYESARRRIFGSKVGSKDNEKSALRRLQKLCDTAYGVPKQGTRKVHSYSSRAKEAAEELSSRINELRKFLNQEASLSDRTEVTDSWQGSWLEDYGRSQPSIYHCW